MAVRRALGYVRVGASEREGPSLDLQQAAIRTHCHEHGLRLVGLFLDEGPEGTAGLEEREGLATALLRLEEGGISSLVVYGPDRLASDLALQELLLVRMQQLDVELQSVLGQELTTEEPARELVRRVLHSADQYEQALQRARRSSARAGLSTAGKLGTRPRYGYRGEEGALVEDPFEQTVIKRVRGLSAEGWSLRMIASILNAEGVAPRAAGAHWQPRTVGALL